MSIVVCTAATVVSSIIILWTFLISKEWGVEFFGRKHLLFCMTFTLMFFSLATSFINVNKPTTSCLVQANFIQIFGVASILYTAAVAVDAYSYIMGFSVPVSRPQKRTFQSEVSDTNGNTNGNAETDADTNSYGQGSAGGREENHENMMSDATLDFYNRDTETNDPATDIIIGIDIVVDVKNKDMDLVLRDIHTGDETISSCATTGDSMSQRSFSTASTYSQSGSRRTTMASPSGSLLGNIRVRPLPRKYKLLHIAVGSYVLLGLILFNLFDMPVTYISPGTEPNCPTCCMILYWPLISPQFLIILCPLTLLCLYL